MDRLLRYFVERHLLVNVIAVALVVLGYLSATSLQREFIPSVDTPILWITANLPGASVYQCRHGNIVRRGRTAFGPGDLYSPVWHFLALAGLGVPDWTPQFHYWRRPERLDDGGENVRC